jgi:hypothetical protein
MNQPEGSTNRRSLRMEERNAPFDVLLDVLRKGGFVSALGRYRFPQVGGGYRCVASGFPEETGSFGVRADV